MDNPGLEKKIEFAINHVDKSFNKISPRQIKDIQDLPYDDFSVLIRDLDERKISLRYSPLAPQENIFNMFAEEKVKGLRSFLLTLPFLSAISVIILSFSLSNYWLFLSILMIPLSSILSSNYMKLVKVYKFSLPSLSLFLSGVIAIFLTAKMNSFALITWVYFVSHLSYLFSRRIVVDVFLKNAVKSELSFVFLYLADCIDVIDSNGINFRRNLPENPC